MVADAGQRAGREPRRVSPGAEGMGGVSLTDVSIAYPGGPPVLRRLTLKIPPGEIFGLHGPNGSGKTTLFRVAAGLLRPDTGEVTIAGHGIHVAPIDVRKRCAFVPDEPMLYPDASSLENLNAFALLWEIPARTARPRAEGLLREAGLWDSRRQWVRGFSRGMRQRLSICAALITNPLIMVLDEPFTGLDDAGVRWMQGKLRGVADAGGSVFVTNHSGDRLTEVADRTGVLCKGQVAIDDFAIRARSGSKGDPGPRLGSAEVM